MVGRLHIVGAGLAGLASAVYAARQGKAVSLYEATTMAGGRCRSFFDSTLNETIDNGSHVVLAGNPAVFKYLTYLGATDELVTVNDGGEIPFVDVTTKQRWTLKPNKGRLPWFVLFPSRRTPDSELSDYAAAAGLFWCGHDKSVQDVLGRTGRTWPRFWDPLSTAVLNTQSDQASASLLGTALKQTILASRGGLSAYVPRTTLSQTFVEPALAFLAGAGADLRLSCPVTRVVGDGRAEQLTLRAGSIDLDEEDSVILAVPPWVPVARSFLPSGFSARPSPIVNAHFKLTEPLPLATNGMIGVINGSAHWVFTREGLVSVTVSANQALAGKPRADIAQTLWQDVCFCLALGSTPCPPHRVIVERRATPIQDTAFAGCRPGPRTFLHNVYLAGDWTDTRLPCTLESAIESGFAAAKAACRTG